MVVSKGVQTIRNSYLITLSYAKAMFIMLLDHDFQQFLIGLLSLQKKSLFIILINITLSHNPLFLDVCLEIENCEKRKVSDKLTLICCGICDFVALVVPEKIGLGLRYFALISRFLY